MFRYLKKLASVVKTKPRRNILGSIKYTWRITKTDRNNIKRIMIFGDSNSFRPEQSKTSWPKLLEDKDPRHLIIFNESYDGRTTRYDLGELNGLSVIGKKLIAQTPLDYVIVMLGTNDLKSKYRASSTTEIVDGMRQILDIIETRGFGAKPILLTPPPIGNVTSGDFAGATFHIQTVADKYRQLAMNRDIRLIDIHSILDISTDLEADMVHLNEVGRMKVANAVWDILQGVNPFYRHHINI